MRIFVVDRVVDALGLGVAVRDDLRGGLVDVDRRTDVVFGPSNLSTDLVRARCVDVELARNASLGRVEGAQGAKDHPLLDSVR